MSNSADPPLDNRAMSEQESGAAATIADVPAIDANGNEWDRLKTVVIWIAALEFAVYHEGWRIRERLLRMATPGVWWNEIDPDATLLLPWLLLAPFCFLFPLAKSEIAAWIPRMFRGTSLPLGRKSAIGWMLFVVSVTSLTMSWSVSEYRVPSVPSRTVREQGPFIHDEFSYRFQAETYLAGRLWWPGVPRARELFHQMHVLNEDRFASRYFPGTGAWLAPFVAIGFPVGASWFAGMLIANLAALIVQRSHGTGAGALTGILVAVAPGNGIVNNLLLAHGPTLVGLLLCLYGFRRLFDHGDWQWAALAGAGLTLAMLSRPLTAASIALPFGVWWFWIGFQRLKTRIPTDRTLWRQGTIAMGIPLLFGFGIMAWQNVSITGKLTLTPYSLYNHLYTPRHAFGFHEGNALPTPPPHRHLKDFDEWARPITWKLAFENFTTRLRESFAWTLGIIPLGMVGLTFLFHWREQSRYDQLLFGSILSVHLAHLPYWLSGLLGYHYVFESGVLWLILLASVMIHTMKDAVKRERGLVPLWIAGFLVLSIATNVFPVAPGRTVPRVAVGIRQVTHYADRYERFQRALAEAAVETPSVVLVKLTKDDIHAEYVRNRPPFDAPILVGRYRPEIYSDEDLKWIFPDRTLYVYDTSSRQLHRLGTTERSP